MFRILYGQGFIGGCGVLEKVSWGYILQGYILQGFIGLYGHPDPKP